MHKMHFVVYALATVLASVWMSPHLNICNAEHKHYNFGKNIDQNSTDNRAFANMTAKPKVSRKGISDNSSSSVPNVNTPPNKNVNRSANKDAKRNTNIRPKKNAITNTNTGSEKSTVEIFKPDKEDFQQNIMDQAVALSRVRKQLAHDRRCRKKNKIFNAMKNLFFLSMAISLGLVLLANKKLKRKLDIERFRVELLKDAFSEIQEQLTKAKNK